MSCGERDAARISSRTASGQTELLLESEGNGHWLVDGKPSTDLDGCFDVDLESSALTNALPVHRLHLEVGEGADAPAAYVRADRLGVHRLQQTYVRVDSPAHHEEYDYEAPAFDFRCRLLYDHHGLVVRYPGIAFRSA